MHQAHHEFGLSQFSLSHFLFTTMQSIINIETNEVLLMPTKQTQYNKKWVDNHKQRAKYLSDRSRSRSFIRNQATLDDIEEFTKLLAKRKEELQ